MDCRVKPGNDDRGYRFRCPSPGSRLQRSPPSPRKLRGEGADRVCGLRPWFHFTRTCAAALCELLHAGAGTCRLCWRRHRAIGDGGGSVAYRRPSWAFPPSTWPRWLLAGGAFFIASGSRSRGLIFAKKNAPAEAGATWHVV